MHNVGRQTITGGTLSECKFEGIDEAVPMIRFYGTAYYRGQEYPGKQFCLGESNLFNHVLLLGSSRSGKTNALLQFAAQLSGLPDSVCIIFDTKGDYKKQPRICRPGDIVLEDSPGCPVWNVFSEITIDGTDDRLVQIYAREISEALFREQKNATNPFFYQAASDLFAGILRSFVYESIVNPLEWKQHLNNKSLKEFILSVDSKGLNELFLHCGKALPDLRNLSATYLGSGNNTQSLGVLAELRMMMNRCFQGIFALAPSAGRTVFSIMKLLRTMRRGNILIEYDIQRGASLTSVYSLLLDLAMKEALSPKRSHMRSSNLFFLLDELKLLPDLAHLEDALNYGRSNRVSVIAGLQDIHQLTASYGDKSKVILSSFGSLIAMKLNDYDSRAFVSDICGRNLLLERMMGKDYLPIEQQRIGNVVEDWDLLALTTGQAIIKLPSQSTPFKFRFSKFS